MKYFFTILLFGLFFNAHAQNTKIDSLQRELQKSKEDTAIFLCLSNLAWEYESQQEMEKAFVYAKKSLHTISVKKITNPKYKGEGNYLLAVLHFEVNHLDSAVFFGKTDLSNFEQIDSIEFTKTRNIVLDKSYNLLSSVYGFYNNQNMAFIYGKMGNYQKAIELYEVSFKQTKEDNLAKLKMSSDLALFYEKTGNYKQAYLYSQ